jgi:hypothetical protein
MKNYYRNYTFDYFPIVGITKEQAINYSKWRSNKVFEIILIHKGVLYPNASPNALNYFTIEKYKRAESLNYRHKQRLNYYVEYMLPSKEERDTILAFYDLSQEVYFDSCQTNYCRMCKDVYPFYNCAELNEDNYSVFSAPTRPIEVDCVRDDIYFPYNLKGNVSEWSIDDSLSFGGGWNNLKEEIIQSDVFREANQNAWTGFRNICRIKKMEN